MDVPHYFGIIYAKSMLCLHGLYYIIEECRRMVLAFYFVLFFNFQSTMSSLFLEPQETLVHRNIVFRTCA